MKKDFKLNLTFKYHTKSYWLKQAQKTTDYYEQQLYLSYVEEIKKLEDEVVQQKIEERKKRHEESHQRYLVNNRNRCYDLYHNNEEFRQKALQRERDRRKSTPQTEETEAKTLCKELHDYTCQVCNAHGKVVTIDAHHIKPVEEKGTNDQSNLVCVCRSCHKKIHGGSLIVNYHYITTVPVSVPIIYWNTPEYEQELKNN